MRVIFLSTRTGGPKCPPILGFQILPLAKGGRNVLIPGDFFPTVFLQ